MRRVNLLIAAATSIALLAPSTPALAGSTLFVESAVERSDDTVTLPVHRGTSQGTTVWYVVLDSSNGNDADRRGVNTAQKLANANAGPGAVQPVGVVNGVIDFPGTVDFSPDHDVRAPAGFPPSVSEPGAMGDRNYSPLIRLPNGTILNAPQIARDQNGDGRLELADHEEVADKVVAIDTVRRTVRYAETEGFARDNPVKYVSTDATDKLAAALEGVTLAPALGAAPFAGGDGTDSARASLAAFVNGQTGAVNPQRQGLNSAVEDGLDPLNLLAWTPNQGRYSPLWDVHLSAWTAAAVAAGQNLRQHSFADVENLAQAGMVTAPDGARWRPSGIIVNCPIISQG